MANTDTYQVPKLLRIGEVAEAFDVTVVTVRAWERDGKISAIRTPGNQRKFRQSDVEALLRGESLTPKTTSSPDASSPKTSAPGGEAFFVSKETS